jgi:hypothetical protein
LVFEKQAMPLAVLRLTTKEMPLQATIRPICIGPVVPFQRRRKALAARINKAAAQMRPQDLPADCRNWNARSTLVFEFDTNGYGKPSS